MEIYIKTSELNKWVAKYFPNQDLITIDNLLSCIEDLDGEVEHLKEQLEDEQENIRENYRRIPVWEQVE